MKILVLNCGSSSLKFKLIETSLRHIEDDADVVIATLLIEKIGLAGAEVHFFGKDGKYYHEVSEILSHKDAFDKAIDLLQHKTIGVIRSKSEIEAVGHRVVHGGEYLSDSVIFDQNVETTIQQCSRFAPLHNPHNLTGIRVAQEVFKNTPNVVSFDTGFHQSIPEKAYLYGIPMYFYYRDGVRRYGFHGLSSRYIMFRLSRLMEKDQKDIKLISCHLGNGASIAAIANGKSVDTSMGFTPLEGLVMGTRCGDLDPEIVIYIMAREGLALHEISSLLNKHSGLLGLSGVSNDMRRLLKEEHKGNVQCRHAIDVFCYRIKKYISSYVGVLNGADGIVFTAGIGENVPEIRERACEKLDFLGIKIDKQKNEAAVGKEMEISTDDSKIKVYVIPTNEEFIIARDTVKVLTNNNG